MTQPKVMTEIPRLRIVASERSAFSMASAPSLWPTRRVMRGTAFKDGVHIVGCRASVDETPARQSAMEHVRAC